MKNKIDIIKTYFNLLENFSSERSAFTEILHKQFRQREFPNLLNKLGQESDFEDTLRRASLGAKILSQQTYEIKNYFESDDQIVLEATWEGLMALDAGPLKANQKLKAHFCIVCEFKDNKIFRQRNYDCFESFN